MGTGGLVYPVIEVASVVVGGLSGALLAERKGFDLVGVLALSVVAGLGGGMIRDVLIQQGPPLALTEERLLWYALGAAAAGFLFGSRLARMSRTILIVDALALSVFTVAGASRTLAAGLGPTAAILLGAITAVGGGAVRDVLGGEPPLVFFAGELFATVAILGGAVYVGLCSLGASHALAGAIAVVFMFALRMLAVRFRWKAPLPLGSKRRYGA